MPRALWIQDFSFPSRLSFVSSLCRQAQPAACFETGCSFRRLLPRASRRCVRPRNRARRGSRHTRQRSAPILHFTLNQQRSACRCFLRSQPRRRLGMGTPAGATRHWTRLRPRRGSSCVRNKSSLQAHSSMRIGSLCAVSGDEGGTGEPMLCERGGATGREFLQSVRPGVSSI